LPDGIDRPIGNPSRCGSRNLCYAYSLGIGAADSLESWNACSQQYLATGVYLGRRHRDLSAAPVHRRGDIGNHPGGAPAPSGQTEHHYQFEAQVEAQGQELDARCFALTRDSSDEDFNPLILMVLSDCGKITRMERAQVIAAK
jgi:hypothetical protein